MSLFSRFRSTSTASSQPREGRAQTFVDGTADTLLEPSPDIRAPSPRSRSNTSPTPAHAPLAEPPPFAPKLYLTSDSSDTPVSVHSSSFDYSPQSSRPHTPPNLLRRSMDHVSDSADAASISSRRRPSPVRSQLRTHVTAPSADDFTLPALTASPPQSARLSSDFVPPHIAAAITSPPRAAREGTLMPTTGRHSHYTAVIGRRPSEQSLDVRGGGTSSRRGSMSSNEDASYPNPQSNQLDPRTTPLSPSNGSIRPRAANKPESPAPSTSKHAKASSLDASERAGNKPALNRPTTPSRSPTELPRPGTAPSPRRDPPRPLTPQKKTLPRVPSNNSLARSRRRGPSSQYSGNDSDSDSNSPDALSFNDEDIPVTGFAVASLKRNADFHELFPGVAEGDYLIEDYGCALQREILIQGRLYISENHMCFYANIFGWVTNLVIDFANIIGLEKKMTAFVIPNAIHVQCKGDVKYTFASFLARDTVFDVIYNIWRLSHPTSPLLGATLPAAAAKRKESAGSEVTPLSLDPSASKGVTPGAGASTTRRPPTTCKCPQHFSEVVMDCVLPGSPESIYNLMFASGFIKNFLTSEQKLIDLQISDWVPEKPDSPLLKRNMSYIKPLNGSIGPKQTKCELTDETLHMDFNDYVCTMTTTRTPDVPSGGVFSVKTRTCITWAGGMHAKVFITTTVEWTGRSFIKSIIERSVLDGQRTYHQDLEKAMRAYIAEHRTEFVPEGEDDLAALAADEIIGADAVPSTPHAPRSPEEEQLERLKDTELRGLQWALDTITGASKVARESFWGAVDVLGDLAESAPAGNMWLWLVLFLLVSNIWTLASLRQANKREDMTRRRAGIGNGYGSVGAGGVEEREREITAQAVRAFLEGITKQQGWAPTGASLEEGSTLINAREEVARLQRSLDAIEVQVGRLRERLHSPASVEGEASGEGSHTEL